MCTCKKYLTEDHKFLYANKGYLLQKIIQISCVMINYCVIYSLTKYLDRQTNFELSHDNKTDNGTYMKKRCFKQQQKIYKLISKHSFKSYREIKEFFNKNPKKKSL